MKKILALTLTCMLALGCAALTVPKTVASYSESPAVAAAESTLYLVPGTYMQGGEKVLNTIASGAEKLSKAQCDAIFTDNAYRCTLSKGAALPSPTSTRVDKSGNSFTFNGWWMIVDATVTYFDKVPDFAGVTFLYADWRADLSQRMDPIEPDPGVVVEPNHYMMVTHADGESEKISLRKASTDINSALDLGYGMPVQLYAQFTLNPGDKFTVYTTGLTDSETPVKAPYADKNNQTRTITLEANGTGTNNTANYLSASGFNYRENPVLTYIADTSGTFNIYLKFFGAGETMNVYMEPAA
ncbi:MAG: hypothetical protein J1F33_07795 [Clostridiales bacterium]|nr:hypothetical protein [Clostridiales bacterium]